MRGGTSVFAAAVVAVAGCAAEPAPSLDHHSYALEAYCEANVTGVGLVDVETDYLAGVINCENGAADFEALKVQAVSARSYLYYKLERYGAIGNGTGDQVYTCGRTPQQEHYDAAAATSGIVLRYMDTQVAAFYVAGALQDGPGCTGGANDPTNTEMYVTYNEGKSGDDIDQTILGFVSPTNHANRGCMSQNGSHCLSLGGRDYQSILRYYYGEDIEITQAEGPCVAATDDPDDVGPDAGPDDPRADQSPSSDRAGVGGCNTSGTPTGAAGGVLVLLALVLSRRRRCCNRRGRVCRLCGRC